MFEESTQEQGHRADDAGKRGDPPEQEFDPELHGCHPHQGKLCGANQRTVQSKMARIRWVGTKNHGNVRPPSNINDQRNRVNPAVEEPNHSNDLPRQQLHAQHSLHAQQCKLPQHHQDRSPMSLKHSHGPILSVFSQTWPLLHAAHLLTRLQKYELQYF